MKILLVGSGAREHAIAKALQRSDKVPTIYCCATAYNPGIQALCKEYWVGDISNVDRILQIAKSWEVDRAIIGPEAPLEKGLADALWNQAIPTIGPKQKLAQIETSKAFARDFMKKYQIPGLPDYRVFHDLSGVSEFLAYLGENNYVIKANGLAGGKGVKVAGDHLHSLGEAQQYCRELYAQGQSFVIEEKLMGQEFSLLCFSDGHSLSTMPLVQDHKRAFIDNKGPNTGGMGSYTDANHRLPFLTQRDMESALSINEMTLNALTTEFRESYIGILYGGFMATADGVRLIEYNARFGDPEALNLLAILESDFVDVCEAMIAGTLLQNKICFASLATVCKYAVPQGYPDHPLKNILIDISEVRDQQQLYLAAINQVDDKLYATGSRTAAVVGIADTIAKAEKIAESEIKRVYGDLFHRQDIGTFQLIEASIQHMQTLRRPSSKS